MGQFTEGSVMLCLDSAKKAEELFQHLETLNTLVTEKYEGYSNYSDHEIFHGKEFSEIHIQFNSGRHINCVWQGELVVVESFPWKDNIIEFAFNLPNTGEDWWIGDEPEEWEEGGSMFRLKERSPEKV